MDALTSFSIKHILLSFIVLLTLAGCEPPDELGNAGERNAGAGIQVPNFEIDNPFGNGGSGDGSDGVCAFPFNLDDPDCAKLCDTQNPPPAECGNDPVETCQPGDTSVACQQEFCKANPAQNICAQLCENNQTGGEFSCDDVCTDGTVTHEYCDE
ncbi:hypothetical protein ABMA57_12105, partial [Saccharospirillum sp. HFRX-1]|uniref:hypothetical protein n=1 Tax=Saccharospirillum sp. HFRX-1 TaxID=3157713 RepID=UPI00371ACF76